MATPKYRRNAGDLRQRSESGEFALRARVPSELELRERYAASRNTVWDAINEGAELLLSPEDVLQGTVRYLADALGLKQAGCRDWITVRAPDAPEATFFKLPPTGRAAVFELFRIAFDQFGRPFRLTVTVFPADRSQFVVDAGRSKGDLFHQHSGRKGGKSGQINIVPADRGPRSAPCVRRRKEATNDYSCRPGNTDRSAIQPCESPDLPCTRHTPGFRVQADPRALHLAPRQTRLAGETRFTNPVAASTSSCPPSRPAGTYRGRAGHGHPATDTAAEQARHSPGTKAAGRDRSCPANPVLPDRYLYRGQYRPDRSSGSVRSVTWN
jgi:hypothetical protein